MILTRKIRLYPTPEQEAIMWASSNILNFAYNCALEHRLILWKHRKFPSAYDQNKEITQIKKLLPELTEVDSQSLKAAVFSLEEGFRSWNTKRKNGDTSARPPRFRSKYKYFTHELTQGILIKDNKIRFNLGRKLSAESPMLRLAESPPENYRSVYISKNQEGWFASFYVQKEEIPFVDNGKVLAADMGIKQFMAARSNEGRVFMSGSISKMTKHYDRKLDKIRSKRDLKKKNSTRYKRLTETYRRVSQKKQNKVQDFLHKLSHKLANKFVENTIVCGDLNPSKWKKSKNKKLNRSVQNNWVVSRFYGMMEYKCKLYGKRFVKINEAYTSKTCSSCGLIHDMPLWRRQMECSCGFSEDRDVNSAINILKRFYAQHGPALAAA